MLDLGDLVRLRPGLYRSLLVPPCFEQEAFAAVVAHPPVTAVTGQAAAYLWGLLPQPPTKVRLVSNQRLRDAHLRKDLSPEDVVRRCNIPVTSLAWTVGDLAATMPDREHVTLVDKALSIKAVTIDELVEQAGRTGQGRHGGTSKLRSALEVWQLRPEMESVAEAAILRAFLRRGIPLPESQHEFGAAGEPVAWTSPGQR